MNISAIDRFQVSTEHKNGFVNIHGEMGLNLIHLIWLNEFAYVLDSGKEGSSLRYSVVIIPFEKTALSWIEDLLEDYPEGYKCLGRLCDLIER